ncbi:MAG TPA: alpha-amylase [Candidatus Blautia faecavium]|uniref:Alpha-amylase n=1 Tax=Candidatus Blautia faecavium TaxID=2838487 RepID=A0A9D2LTK3_9FIRM|nr:alpha-amylase [Candidatus Blautia faecavium]
MANNTKKELRNLVIYSVYVRNHSEEGTFAGVEKDLDRIKNLGTDVVWFMPTYPIGKKNKKGSLGCPYAIADYRGVNPEYGTREEFEHLIEEIHKRGMKCMMDVVYNHTSPDSWLSENRPDYFYKKADGSFGNKTGDWGDVIDLDYNNKELWDYQIETLCQWAELVDGFRCDVAPLVPVAFWIKAREAVEKVKPGFIWLAETVEPCFIRDNRKLGQVGQSDGEMYQAFDMEYDYDIWEYRDMYLAGEIPLKAYVKILNQQHITYPDNYVKMRCLENHDQRRAKAAIPNESDLINWTAFMFFQQGSALIYAGQETENDRTPSLFDIDKVDWNTGKDISGILTKLAQIKKKDIMAFGAYRLYADEVTDTVIGEYEMEGRKMVGAFALKSQEANVKVDLPDGVYTNLLDGSKICVSAERMKIYGRPVIIEA